MSLYPCLCRPSRLPNLQNFTRQRLIPTQHRPRCSVCLGQRQLQFRAQNLERRLFGVDAREKWHISGIALWRGVAGCEIEGESALFELDLCCVLDDLLEEERCDDGGRCLVKVMSVSRMLVRRYVMTLGHACKVGTYLTVERTSSPPAEALSFLPLPTNKCLSFVLHPSIFRN